MYFFVSESQFCTFVKVLVKLTTLFGNVLILVMERIHYFEIVIHSIFLVTLYTSFHLLFFNSFFFFFFSNRPV